MSDDPHNSVKEEFSRISGRVVYLDTNVISYLYGGGRIDDDKLRKKAMFSLLFIFALYRRENTAFPYSMAHLRDIMSGGESYENQKLSDLERHSGRWKISPEPNSDFVRLDKVHDLAEDYKYLKNSTKQAEEITRLVNAGFAPLFHKTAETVSAQLNLPGTRIEKDVAEKILSTIRNYNSKSGLEFARIAKRMRSMKILWDGKRVYFPTLGNTVTLLPREKLVALVDAAIQKMNPSIGGHEAFFELLTNQFKGRIHDRYSHNVTLLALLCDMLGITSEKLDKESSFDSIITDAFHLSFGLRSHLFVTEDKNLLTKAMFVKNWLQLPVRVLDLNGLISETVMDLLVERDAKAQKDDPIILKFASEDGGSHFQLRIALTDKECELSLVTT